VALLALSLLILSMVMIWLGVLTLRQETAEQQAVREENAISPPSDPQPEDFPLLFSSGPASGSAEGPAASGHARGIPGLTEMQVIANLQYLPDSNFRCPGASPDQDGRIRRGCTSTKDDDPAVYEVALVEEDPATVLSVRATARNASDAAVAEFLGYVAKLSLDEADIDAESWVGRNLSSGGQHFADGAEVRLYGTEGNRTLDITATAPPASRSPETTTSRSPETTTSRSSRDAKASTNRRP
jgi:hypothetical protein